MRKLKYLKQKKLQIILWEKRVDFYILSDTNIYQIIILRHDQKHLPIFKVFFFKFTLNFEA